MSVCSSVCPSVTFVSCAKTNKDIFQIFSLSGSHTILVFTYQTGCRHSDGNRPNGGVKCRWGRQKSRFWAYIWLHFLLLTLQQAKYCQHGRRWTMANVPQVMTLIWLVVTAVMRVFDHQAPRAITGRRGSTAQGRPSALLHYTQSTRQQSSTLRRRQRNRIELYALVNPKPK